MIDIAFIGGPGRSGTSFTADRLGAHPQVAALKDVELKIFYEKNGLFDLCECLTKHYSPNRADTAFNQFQSMTNALIQGDYGQPALKDLHPIQEWQQLFTRFCASLLVNGQPVQCTLHDFFQAARELLDGLASIAAQGIDDPRIFVEKTPHNLLAMDFLVQLKPGAKFVHVMRDPRLVAYSLVKMPWGPQRIDSAAEWVASYCRAWLASEARAADSGCNLLRLYIEDVSADSETASLQVTTWLGLNEAPALFERANLKILDQQFRSASPEEVASINGRLGGWVDYFGYDQASPGRRSKDS